jgi:hypothetical protein
MALSLVQGPFSVAPCQTVTIRFATFSSSLQEGGRTSAAQPESSSVAVRKAPAQKGAAEGGKAKAASKEPKAPKPAKKAAAAVRLPLATVSAAHANRAAAAETEGAMDAITAMLFAGDGDGVPAEQKADSGKGYQDSLPSDLLFKSSRFTMPKLKLNSSSL